MLRRLLVALSVLAFAACGGAGGSISSPSSTTAPAQSAMPSATAPPFREILVTVDGRKFSGHCAGETQAGSPTVILESGLGNDQNMLQSIESELNTRTMVCAYDRSGMGQSDPPAGAPRPLTDVVSDLHAFLSAAKIEPPYFLVGQSMGGNIVFMYAQAYPNEVAGFVSMNPVPPYTDWIRAASKVETKAELHDYEIVFYQGQNDEQVTLQSTDQMLEGALPDTVPYAVMFAEDCGGDTAFCDRILPPLSAATKALAGVGKGGSFVWVKNAGHEIYTTDLDVVVRTIDGVLSRI